jgi:hypothetical protein
MFLEIMAEMEKPSDFVFALRAASLVRLAPGAAVNFARPCLFCMGNY